MLPRHAHPAVSIVPKSILFGVWTLLWTLSTEAARGNEALFKTGCYSALGNTVVLKLPSLDPNEWTIERPTERNAANLLLGFRSPDSGGGFLQLFHEENIAEAFGPGATAASIAQTMMTFFTKDRPWLEEYESDSLLSDSGRTDSFELSLAGSDPDGDGQVWTLIATTDGKAAVAMLAVSDWAALPEINDVLKNILQTLQIGSQVPRLPQLSPGTAIEGVYVHSRPAIPAFPRPDSHDWLVFDKRGFVHGGDPSSDLWASDLEELYRCIPNALGSYTATDGTVEITWPGGRKASGSLKDADGLFLDGHSYARADRGTDVLLSARSAAAAPDEDVLFEDDCFVAPGRAALGLSWLGSNWTIQSSVDDGIPTLKLFLGPPESYSTFIFLGILPKSPQELSAKEIAQAGAADLREKFPWMQETTASPLASSPGRSDGFEVSLAGVDRERGPSVAKYIGIIESGVAAGVMVFSSSDRGEEVNDVLKDILRDLRVGSQLPRLPKRSPGTPIEGVYANYQRAIGGSNRPERYEWLVFDKRGFVHRRNPRWDLYFSRFEELNQCHPNLLGSYTLKDGKVEITWHDENGEEYKWDGSIDDEDSALIEGRVYKRAERNTDGLKLDGAYQHVVSSNNIILGTFSYSKETLVFTPDGKFEEHDDSRRTTLDTNSSVAGTLPGTTSGNTSVLLDQGTFGYHSESKDRHSGTYAIHGNEMTLTHGDGTTTTYRFYRIKNGGPGAQEVIFLNGVHYY